jgi:rod shape-determining protein MreC
VYDKTVRRRRAVLGLLVASSLILLTAYFGESAGGGLHAVQRGALDVVSPIQEGASRALKPFRDLFGWVGDTLHAKGEVKDLRRERDALRQQVIANQVAALENRQLRAQAGLNAQAGLSGMGPVTAQVIAQDPNLWFTQITINRGTADGVRTNQPVVTGQGLVGRVTFTTSSTAIVTLITDHSTQVGATVAESSVKGLIEVEAGRPTDLVLTSTAGNDVVTPGQTVVTSGTISKVDRFPSPYPSGIPIGRVSRVDNAGSDDQQPHVTPFADVRRLDLVEVLTKAQRGSGP